MGTGQSVSIDFMVAIGIFVIGIATGIYLLNLYMTPDQGFSGEVRSATDTAWTNFIAETEWTVHRMPVTVDSGYALDGEPVEITVDYPGPRIEGSVLVMNESEEIASQHDHGTNTTLFVGDLRNGSTTFHVVWTEEENVSERSYTTDLSTGSDTLWNSDVNLTVSATGIDDLSFNGTSFLTDPADLSVGSSPSLSEELLRATASYGDTDLTLYEDASHIPIAQNTTGETHWYINVTDDFDTLYADGDGGTMDIGTGTIYTGTTDWLDVSDDSNGLSIVGDSLSFNVTRNDTSSPVEIDVNVTADTEREVVLVPHTGNHTAAADRANSVNDPPSVHVGVVEERTGVSADAAETLSAANNTAETLGLSGLTFNASMGDIFTGGRDVVTGTNLVVRDYPVPVLQRFGNATAEQLVFRVWE